jgi:hypothetical protein
MTRDDLSEELRALLDDLFVHLGQSRHWENDSGDFIFRIEEGMGKIAHLVSPEAIEKADQEDGDNEDEDEDE